MVKRMGRRKVWLIPLAASVAACISAAPASAASTRAEYTAQVDPICAAAAPVIDQAYSSYNRSYKRWVHLTTHGSLKTWVKQTRRMATTLSGFVEANANLTNQVAAVSPAPGDESTIGTWLDYRRRAEAFGAGAATALRHIQLSKFDKLGHQADKAAQASVQVAEGIGFTVCDQLY
jgi:hypothetical protein